MRIRTGKTKNGRLFYVIKTYYDSRGVEHTVTVEKLGNENDIKARTGRDPDQWAKEYVAKLNEEAVSYTHLPQPGSWFSAFPRQLRPAYAVP